MYMSRLPLLALQQVVTNFQEQIFLLSMDEGGTSSSIAK